MKVVAIVQARMGSTRLPGKVLCDIAGRSMLARVIERLRRAYLIDELLVATTTSNLDEDIVEECKEISVGAFRGPEENVLDRYRAAALSVKADVIVRITSDCPLIDPEITDLTIRRFLDDRPDYASNCLQRTYPRGLDTEVFSARALERAWKEAVQPYERAHVTPYIFEHPDKFKLASVFSDTDHSQYRWTVDTFEDLSLVRAVYERLGDKADFSWRDVLALMQREPQLAELNRGVVQKAVHLG